MIGRRCKINQPGTAWHQLAGVVVWTCPRELSMDVRLDRLPINCTGFVRQFGWGQVVVAQERKPVVSA